MTLRLLLIRHAKSSWDDPGLGDHERPLNARGRRGASVLGGYLAREGLRPGHALVSTATRARETWARILAETGEVPTTLVPRLYDTDAETMLDVLVTAPASGVVAVVGHNPTIGEFARRLLAAPPADEEFAKYPTAATAVIDLPAARWSEVDWGTGTLARFVTPRRIEASAAGSAGLAASDRGSG
jgi:phosphohistidine phosphatase